MSEEKSQYSGAPEVDHVALRELVDSRSRTLGLTRERVARAAGVGRSTLFDWLAGTARPSVAGWGGLAAALELPVADMFSALGAPLTSAVERARLERGLTRGELAAASGVALRTLRMLEEGAQVRPDAAARVAVALGLEPGFLTEASRVRTRAVTPLARAIEDERVKRGWTIADLARHLGTVRQLVSAWHVGAEPVAARWLPALAELTGLPLGEVEALAAHSEAQRADAFARDIVAGRVERGWSREHLAARAGVSPDVLAQWEEGTRRVSTATRRRLQQVCTSP